MNFLFVILIVGVLTIVGMFVLSHYRGEHRYKPHFGPTQAPARRGQTTSPAMDSTSIYPPTLFAGSSDDSSHSSNHHGHVSAPDCGAGHDHGGDAGGGCSDGGGGGH